MVPGMGYWAPFRFSDNYEKGETNWIKEIDIVAPTHVASSLFRSLCSVVCKWGYLADPNALDGWSSTFLNQIGLGDLVEDGFKKLGK